MTRRVLVGVLLSLVLVGCSQVDALAPVGGNRLAEVRFAALDVLLDAEVDLLTAPVCTASEAGAVECTGSTLAGAAVLVDAPVGNAFTMTVRVDGRVLYDGAVRDVLDAAAEGRRTEPTR